MRGKPYSFFKRGHIWYVQFKNPDNTYTSAKSTGQTTKGAADRFAFDYLQNGKIVLRENITIEEFSKGFFDWNGSWATDKRSRGLRISERHCLELSRTLQNHVIPRLERIRLSNIDRALIRDFRNSLYTEGYAGSTINHALLIIKAILEAAEELSLIRGIPKIDRAANNPKHKGILTLEEVRSLFEVELPDFRADTASLLASATGLRLGEVLGLVVSDFHQIDRFIHCRRSWDQSLW